MNDSNSCLTCVDSNCFIKSCYPDWIFRIMKTKSETKYKKGEYIFRVRDHVKGLFFVKNGKIKVVSTGLNGKEQIVRLAGNGHILGHRGFGGKSKEVYPVSAIALEDSVICFVDNDTIYEAFYMNTQFVIELMMFYSKELRAMEVRMKYMAQMTVRERIAFSLLYLKDVFGYESSEQELNANISRADIAALSGTNKEQVIRNLTELEKEGSLLMLADENPDWGTKSPQTLGGNHMTI